jgi:hypothetical protein
MVKHYRDEPIIIGINAVLPAKMYVVPINDPPTKYVLNHWKLEYL